MSKVTPRKFVVGPCRLSYVNVFEPGPPMNPGDEPVRSASLLFPKTDKKAMTILAQKMNEIVNEAIQSKLIPSAVGIHNPLRDGDAEVAAGNRGKEYAGMVFMNAKSWRPIGVVNAQNEPILDADELYSGCWGNVQISFKYFNRSGNKGIRVELNLVQKVRDDDRFDGVDNAEDVFEVHAVEETAIDPATTSGIPAIPGLPNMAEETAKAQVIVDKTAGAGPATETGAKKTTEPSNPFAQFV